MCSQVSPLDTPRRRATDADEPTNREILDKLEAFMAEHRRDHATLDLRLARHDVETAQREAVIGQLQSVVPEVQVLRDFRVQVETIGNMAKFMVGGSLLAALAAVASLIATFSHIIQTGP